LGVLIDTSVLIAVERSGAPPEALLASAGAQPAFLAAISASELLHGVHRADGAVRRGRRARFVEAVLSSLQVIPFDLEIARVHSQLWADLAGRGRQIGAHDLQIAATAVHRGLSLVTANARELGRVPGLSVEMWR
jgi:tRNA(fMet)-specific endonuclease VapC